MVLVFSSRDFNVAAASDFRVAMVSFNRFISESLVRRVIVAASDFEDTSESFCFKEATSSAAASFEVTIESVMLVSSDLSFVSSSVSAATAVGGGAGGGAEAAFEASA